MSISIGLVIAILVLAVGPSSFSERGLLFSPQSFLDISLLLAAMGGVFTIVVGCESRDQFERSHCQRPRMSAAARVVGISASLVVTVLSYAAVITLLSISLGQPLQPAFLLRLVWVSVLAAMGLGAWTSGMAGVRRGDVRNAAGIGGLFVLAPRFRDLGRDSAETVELAAQWMVDPWIPATLCLAGIGCITLALLPQVWAEGRGEPLDVG